MRSPLWAVIGLITANIVLAGAILLAVYVHWAIWIVAVGMLAVVLAPLLSRWRRDS